jgi:pyridoxal phosphate enzyme (YggS family)
MEREKYADLLGRYDAVMARINEAAEKYGRSAGDVRLVVAAKYATAEEICALARYRGLDVIGENRVDTLLEHYEGLEHPDEMEIHFIGHLQRNKVKYIIDKVDLIHSLDSLALAEELERAAAKRDITVRVLVEINIGREESKNGVMPEDAESFCESLSAFPHIKLCGFMTMAPKSTNFDEYRNYFQETYQLVLDIWTKKLHNIYSPILSMGMSDSFEAAIAAGATHVRVGSSVFGRTTADMKKQNS